MSRAGWLTKTAALFLLLALLSVGMAAGCGDEEADEDLEPTTIGEYNKPGVVLVESFWTADVTIPDISFDEDALFAYFQALYAEGYIPEDITEQELLDLMIEELVLNPEFYVYATVTDRVTSMESSSYGSGFIVTEDGYALTNAHVVKKSDEDLQLQMALEAGNDFLYEDLYRFEEYIGIDLSPEYEEYFLATVASIYDQYMTVSSPDSEFYMYMVNVDGELSDPIAVELVEAGDPIDMMEETGKDVAVIKVNEDNLPTVAIGDDEEVRDGEKAIALGYPSVATFDPGFDLTDLAPTLTQGTISARKTMEGGWEVIQTDATISGGSSGSPLLNSSGEAIGINTFGATELDEATGEAEVQPGYNYAVPASVAMEYLDKANVEPELGPLTVKYHEAVDEYENEHYQDAKELFEEIDAANSDFPYVDEYIENATAKINEGLDQSGGALPTWLLIVLIAGGALIIVGGGGYLAMRSRGKQEPAAAAAGAGAAGAAAVPEPAPAPAAEAEATREMPAAPAAEAAPEAAPEADADETSPPEEASKEAEGEGEQGFCHKCGTQLDQDDAFCSKCGTHRK